MFNTIVKTDKVILKPCELGYVEKSITKKLEDMSKICTKEHGYVLTIDKIISYHNNIISRTSGNCIFNVSYQVTTIRPEVGHQYKAVVSLLYKEGIFANFNDIKILVPSIELQEWEYKNSYYQHNVSQDPISIGSWIQVELKIVRYENHTYQCIGTIV